MNRSSALWTIAIVALSAIILLVIVLTAPKQAPKTVVDGKVPDVTAEDWVRGKSDAKVTLIEYGDFQCPACAQFESVIQSLSNDFPDTLRVVFRHFPLPQHVDADLAARASEAAGAQGKFFEMHDVLYAKQTEWANVPSAKDIMTRYAKELELNLDQWNQDLYAPKTADHIELGKREAKDLGLQGTPSFFLNGKPIENPKSYDDFRKLIEDAAQ
jgi:protein-disulfide isomerase